MKSSSLARKLLRWYDTNKRDLPWRGTRDPYAIWLSEVMLQQTTVKAVEPRWRRFLERWPTLRELAQAPVADVLHEWTGLGYYARARNMHRAAMLAGDALPRTYAELLKLPGLGEYTAAAVASIAHGERVPLVDANVERVLARVHTVAEEIRSAPAKKKLRALADALVPANRPGDFNQALMELGAMTCTPQKPMCRSCPITEECGAFQTATQEQFPRIKPKQKMKTVQEATIVIRDARGRVLLLFRGGAGSFANMWELPRVTVAGGESLSDAAVRAAQSLAGLQVTAGPELMCMKHTVMRSRIALHVMACARSRSAGNVCLSEHEEARWVTLVEWEKLPKSITQERVRRALATSALRDG
ncbi:A/G-specific adenine glycosylase [Candidatus Sumerlaeota bacterium]|nr:A/G-specific adenine glycosylase [Candidatus Sumerlaeota bacterium]